MTPTSPHGTPSSRLVSATARAMDLLLICIVSIGERAHRFCCDDLPERSVSGTTALICWGFGMKELQHRIPVRDLSSSSPKQFIRVVNGRAR